MKFPQNIAVLGGGSWATALASVLLKNCETINWYMRRDDRIEEFQRLRRNPAYLTDVRFDTERIFFSSDLNKVVEMSDTLLFAMPSPYFKDHLAKLTADISDRAIVNAIKGIVPGDNMLITDYMVQNYGISPDKAMVVSGPCHAEEVALDRPSYLTVGGRDIELAGQFASVLESNNVHAIVSSDVTGIGYAGVLKNVYAIAAGIVHGMKKGDNFLAMLVSNAIREMERFLDGVDSRPRQICDSVYLGDLLVTAYSRFSRNHNFGALIGRGYSVKAAKMEMEQVAEGYFGVKCIHEINEEYQMSMPILEGVYDILYRRVSPEYAISTMAKSFI
ncbi:MAG: NAD(P)H-dependent glycerol-3-phosphate dehydrogenase [Bacteroidales bacterium]|nr:NAD(P)H-dependent glycerol-3-phosphate dehydrogenase [Bacteroidales bacterium]MBD5235369.1 NAD(P)H-dependent glycerol-3-phosphate dehydrogenase [Barnesiella sp.]MBD5246689.1 NAD(P)H-dependent glycerol-3-phosphate dehydrogenase [Barnesiella sp.]MBD5247074.1 NAD(P)H-dependent glycerol-3-phosphate dehydrogenase [Barnesiella sp.]MBD5258113.1 NAD(P)H-dependent glycerol-3-phosphate dehydrogenase [Barnesiella sp.]